MPKPDLEIITPIEDIDNTVTPPETDEEYTTIHHVQIIGISHLDTYKSCIQCKARVEPQTPPLAKCTNEDCLMIQAVLKARRNLPWLTKAVIQAMRKRNLLFSTALSSRSPRGSCRQLNAIR